MSRSGNGPMDEYERAAEAARRVLSTTKTGMKLSNKPFLSNPVDNDDDDVSCGKISLTFTLTMTDQQR
jgi:hypothetical protein